MQLEYSHMPTMFDSAAFRVRRDRRHGLTYAVRVRFHKWRGAVERRKREQALDDCLRQLDRHTLDDIGLASASLPPADKFEVEERGPRCPKPRQ
jgi:hypothetical protein